MLFGGVSLKLVLLIRRRLGGATTITPSTATAVLVLVLFRPVFCPMFLGLVMLMVLPLVLVLVLLLLLLVTLIALHRLAFVCSFSASQQQQQLGVANTIQRYPGSCWTLVYRASLRRSPVYCIFYKKKIYMYEDSRTL